MVLQYTQTELLALFRLAMGLEPLRSDGVVTRTDGIDLDRLITLRMKAWYADLLDNAPIKMLSTTDLAMTASLLLQSDSSGLILLPEGVRRIVEVKLGGWERPGRIVTPADDDYADVALCQHSKYTHGGCIAPIVLHEHNRLRLYSPPSVAAHPAIERLKVVMEPSDPDTYIFTDRALATIPTDLQL